MLRLYDSGTGRVAPVVPAHRGELRTYLAGPAAGGPLTVTDVRSLLLADLIRRVADSHGLLVMAWQSLSAGRDGTALAVACGTLNIYPADYTPRPPGDFDLGVAASAGAPVARSADAGAAHPGGADAGATAPAARWVRPAGVAVDGAVAPGLPDTLAGLAGRGLDPLALRLVLLREHYRRALQARWDALAAADADLRRWRELVGGWANHPSRPMSAPHLKEAAGALDDDLDVPAALRALDALAAEPTVPPGSKFETFAHLDRVLALDLAREVGRW